MNPDILTKEQITFLELIGSTPALQTHFYLTGGTPLAAFYLKHRFSEDIDFFSEQEVDTAALNVFFKKYKKELGITHIDFEQTYNRNLFFLTTKNGVLKTEFTHFPFPRIEKGGVEFGVAIDSIIDIAVNKLFTIYQRTKARDYIDLYYLCQTRGFMVSDLMAKARIKFDTHIDPIGLGAQFMKASEAVDYPRMVTAISPETWQRFFIEEAKKLKPNVME